MVDLVLARTRCGSSLGSRLLPFLPPTLSQEPTQIYDLPLSLLPGEPSPCPFINHLLGLQTGNQWFKAKLRSRWHRVPYELCDTGVGGPGEEFSNLWLVYLVPWGSITPAQPFPILGP